MREILFRGKRIDNGEWVCGWYTMGCFGRWPLKDCIIPSQLAIEVEIRSVEVDAATVGQYTGLTDKNGEKIWEGDRVDILCENEETGVIEWSKDTARFIVSANGFEADFDNYYGTDLEVIGTIHDRQAGEGA